MHREFRATDTGSPNALSNLDGYGVAIFSDTAWSFDPASRGSSETRFSPTIYRSVRPPLNDLHFKSVAATTASRCVLAHVRAVSSP